MPLSPYYQSLTNELNQLLSMGSPYITLAENPVNMTPQDKRVKEIRELLATAQSAGTIEEQPSAVDQQRLQSLLDQFQQAHEQGNAANEARYQQLLSGYNQRTSEVLGSTQPYGLGSLPGRYETLAQQQAQTLGDVTQGYQDRLNQLNGLFTGLGDQARSDVTTSYNRQRAAADSSLTSRGLGNTTVRSAVMSGIGTQENQDLARLNEQLRREQIGYQSQWLGDVLGSRERAAGLNYQAGLQGAQFGERYANTAAGLMQEPLGVIERRNDNVPSMVDIANLMTQLGKSAANRTTLPVGYNLFGTS